MKMLQPSSDIYSKEKEEIDSIIASHAQAPHNRLLQSELAKDIT